MSDDFPWSQDHDPGPDPILSRMLRAAGGEAPLDAVDWEGLHARVTQAAAHQLRSKAGRDSAEWYDFAARWIPPAAAAVLGAILLGGALVATTPGPLDPDQAESQSPEAVAVARVVAAYPDDAVLASLIGSETDEGSEWSAP
jgi:hypothetical protein